MLIGTILVHHRGYDSRGQGLAVGWPPSLESGRREPRRPFYLEDSPMTDPAAPAPVPAPAPAAAPGKTLGIVGLILAFLGPVSLVGLILSIVARSQSKKAGVTNTPATVGIIIGIIVLVVTIIFWVVAGIGAAALLSQCADLGPGVHDVNGVTVTCS